MSIRKEQAVLLVTLAILLWLARGWFDDSEAGGRRRTRRSRPGGDVVLVHHGAPEIERALPRTRDLDRLQRDPFAEPRDSLPLPPLELEPPPLGVQLALRPPPAPGPLPALYGRLLRADPTPTAEPEGGLFEAEQASEEEVDPLAELERVAAQESAGGDPLAEQISTWRGLYDSLRIHSGMPLFGRIANDDRFDLARRPQEPILFVEIDPRTGEERFPGQVPVPFERERVQEFAFADTPANRIALRSLEFGDSITPGQFSDVLEFADWCVEQRHAAESALPAAERMYRLAATVAADDPAPRLGLARCLAVAFEFDRAYAEVLRILEDFPHRSEPWLRLADIEARLRLDAEAEEHLREAQRVERTSWAVQWALGRFLLERGRAEEALEHLRLAFRYEPGVERGAERVGIRVDLGAALLATGSVEEGLDLFEKALQADPDHPTARAGRTAAMLLGDGAAVREPGEGLLRGVAGFEGLHDAGLVAIERGEWQVAENALRAAAREDPLRTARPLGALSWLAEVTGNAEEALTWIEQAIEADPGDAWSLFQRGRLLEQRDALEEARASYRAALEVELDLVDALVALGRLNFEGGRHAPAERYLERALSLAPERVEAHALRGLNLLELGDVAAAEAACRAGLALDPAHPLARNGLAWCLYRRGEAQQAISQLADTDDLRRDRPEDDPHRAWARRQIERIGDHLQKVAWSDRFERRILRNDWNVDGESAGPTATLAGGALLLEGSFARNGTTRVHRSYPAPDFVSFEADLVVRAGTRARVGVFLAKERRGRAGGSEVLDEVALSRHREGNVQTRLVERGEHGASWVDHPAFDWPTDRAVRVRIERVGTGSDATGRILLDGVPVAEQVPLRAFAATTGAVKVGVFVEGETGRSVRFEIDEVQVVYRLQG